MKSFAVLALCATACVAVPNGYYGQQTVRQVAQPSYAAAPTAAPVVRVIATTAAPVVVRDSYSSYAAPAYQQPAQQAYAAKTEIPIVRYNLDTDNYGTYKLNTETADRSVISQEGSLKTVTGSKTPVNVMKGSYSYVGEDNKTYTVTYVADENGFRPMGDHLPTPHPEIAAALAMMGPGSD